MSSRRLLLLAVLSFAVLGMPKAAFGVAWPSVAGDLGRPLAQLGTVITVYVAGYFLTTLLTGWSLRLVGTGPLLAGASGLGAVALVGYTVAGEWWVLMVSAVALGASGGWIDAAVNSHVALHHGARAMGVLHAGFGIGSTLGPLILTVLVDLDRSWRIGFGLLAVAQIALTAGFLVVMGRWGDPPAGRRPERPRLERPAVLMVTLVVFALYTGLELGAGQWAFTLLSEGREVSERVAGLAVVGFWGGLTASRLLMGVIGDRLPPSRTLLAGTISAAVTTGLVWWSPLPWVGPVALVLTGFVLGPIFPLQTLLTPGRMGTGYTPWAVGFQIAAANLGAAAIPGSIGLLVSLTGLESIGGALAVTAVALAAATRILDRMTPADRVPSA